MEQIQLTSLTSGKGLGSSIKQALSSSLLAPLETIDVLNRTLNTINIQLETTRLNGLEDVVEAKTNLYIKLQASVTKLTDAGLTEEQAIAVLTKL